MMRVGSIIITGAYAGGSGQWVTYGNQANNYQYLDLSY
jgi:hypothetical protein